MPSTTPCVLHSVEACSNSATRTYLARTPKEFSICRQCSQKLGAAMLINVILDGEDIELMFRAIMDGVADKRRSALDDRDDD